MSTLQKNEEQEVQTLEITDRYRIDFAGILDPEGSGYGQITMYNLANGLEEVSIEGYFQNGLLEGKVR